MSIVKSSGAVEKVTIDGQKVRRLINLKSTSGAVDKGFTESTITKAFVFKNELYCACDTKLYKYNYEDESFTLITTAPTKYIFCNQENIYCGQHRYGYKEHYLYLYKYDSESNSFTEIDYTRVSCYFNEDTGRYTMFYGYGASAGGCLHYSINGSGGLGTATIGDVFNYPVATVFGTYTNMNVDGNFSTYVRCVEFNGKSYFNGYLKVGNTNTKQFTMYINAEEFIYEANQDFMDKYMYGSLAVINNKLYLYGTSSIDGITRRIEWTGTTYENEENLTEQGFGVNVNNSAIFEYKDGIILVGQGNKVFENTILYIEI